MKKVCGVCGKTFETNNERKINCSPECSSILKRKPANSASEILGKNKVIEVPNEELKVRVASLTDDYKFTEKRRKVLKGAIFSCHK